MARPKNPAGGRPARVEGEATRLVAAKMTDAEIAQLDELALRWTCDRSEAIRRAVAWCERRGVKAATGA